MGASSKQPKCSLQSRRGPESGRQGSHLATPRRRPHGGWGLHWALVCSGHPPPRPRSCWEGGTSRPLGRACLTASPLAVKAGVCLHQACWGRSAARKPGMRSGPCCLATRSLSGPQTRSQPPHGGKSPGGVGHTDLGAGAWSWVPENTAGGSRSKERDHPSRRDVKPR